MEINHRLSTWFWLNLLWPVPANPLLKRARVTADPLQVFLLQPCLRLVTHPMCVIEEPVVDNICTEVHVQQQCLRVFLLKLIAQKPDVKESTQAMSRIKTTPHLFMVGTVPLLTVTLCLQTVVNLYDSIHLCSSACILWVAYHQLGETLQIWA